MSSIDTGGIAIFCGPVTEIIGWFLIGHIDYTIIGRGLFLS